MKIFINFLKKMSSFWQFFDSQMAIFRRVSYSSPNVGVSLRDLLHKWNMGAYRTQMYSTCHLLTINTKCSVHNLYLLKLNFYT